MSFATSLATALRDVRALSLAADGDPLRLELPPDDVGDSNLTPVAAGVLGSLYLLSELEHLGVVACAELLAAERWSLAVADRAAVRRLESYAAEMDRRPRAAMRAQLYARLFGSVVAPEPATSATAYGAPVGPAGPIGNDVFEELLAGYCDAIASFDPRRLPHARTGLRLTGDRLRANLAPRQYGNTLIVATPLVEQLQASLALLGEPAVGALFHTTGAWGVVRALQPDEPLDIGRRVHRGQAGREVVASVGYPAVPDLVDGALVRAADQWLAATGFDDRAQGG